MNKKVTLTGANIVFFIFCIVFITYQVVLAVILGDKLNDNLYTIVLINEFVMILVPVLVYCLIKKINIKEAFRFNNPGLVPMLLVTAISIPAYFFAAMLNNMMVYLLQFVGDLPTTPIPAPKNLSELVVGILIIAVSPGICEEILHRGLLLRAYERRGSYKAIVIVAIFFGIFHFDITNLFGPIFLGLIIGYYVIRTNSIFAGILAHFLNNTIAEILQYINRDQIIPDKMTVSWQELQQLIIAGIGSFIIIVVLLKLFKAVTENKAEIIQPISAVRLDVKAILSHWPVILVLLLYILMALIYLLSVIMMKYLM